MAVNRELRVLILEDVLADAELCQRELKRAGLRFAMRRVDTRDTFERALDEFPPDLVISDFSLPTAFDGLAALDLARGKLPEVPFVFVSGTIGEERAVDAMKRGATDYVLKDKLSRLVPVVKRALEEARERATRREAEQELERTRSQLNSIVSSLTDVVWSFSLREKRLVYVNAAIEKMWGRPMADFYADPHAWLVPIHPQDRERVEREWQAAPATGVFDSTYRIMLPDGGMRWIHDRGRVIRDAVGEPERIDGLARDMTERKVQEERIARLSRIRAMLSGINSAIVRISDRDELFHEACRIATEDGGFALAWIGTLDPRTLEVTPGVWQGEGGDFLESLRASVNEDSPVGRGTTALALRTRKTVIINDIANDPRVKNAAGPLGRGFRAFIALPLLVEGKVCGVIKLYAKETGVFDQEEVKLLEDLAADISFALDHLAKADRLDYLAYYDGVTGIANRKLFHEQVVKLIHSIAPEEQGVAVAVLDLERFRNINETLGMAAGDAILKQIAERLSTAVGEPGTVARISADRFAVALVPMRSETEVAHVLERRVFAALNEPFPVNDQELRIPAKAGVAVYPGDGRDVTTLFVNAEAALMKAKQSGERFLFYAPQMNARVAEQLRLENELRVALREEQFVLHYQPRVALATGHIEGMEALIRWQHPERGLVLPAEFIPVLEETSMILEVGLWVIERAAADYTAWCARGLKPPPIAVNVSAIQLRQKGFVECFKSAVALDGDYTYRVELELTESMVMDNIEENIQKLKEIRAAGMRIAIDDFGTGYSSLRYLARLPVDALKIDSSFVAGMNTSPEYMAIVATVISLAHSLNLKVVAEGVESQEQLNLLKLLKCDEIQGYLFSRPLPAEQVEAMFER